MSIFDLKKILAESGGDFNPTIILKKSPFKIEPLVQIHRYTAGEYRKKNTPIRINIIRNLTFLKYRHQRTKLLCKDVNKKQS